MFFFSSVQQFNQFVNAKMAKSQRQRPITQTVKNESSNYCEWLKMCKVNLKVQTTSFTHDSFPTVYCDIQVRDCKRLKIITIIVQAIVNEELEINTPIFTIYSEIINDTIKIFSDKIDDWNGIHFEQLKNCKLYHTVYKQTLQRYEGYLAMSIVQWEHNKMKIFGSVFWLRVFKQIRQVCVHRNTIMYTIYNI